MCRQSGGGFFVFLELHLRSIFNAHIIDYLRRSPLYTRTSTQSDEKIIAMMQADQEQGWPLCPRCGERMPDKLTHGALSRHAKGVYICEACGTDEVLDAVIERAFDAMTEALSTKKA